MTREGKEILYGIKLLHLMTIIEDEIEQRKKETYCKRKNENQYGGFNELW